MSDATNEEYRDAVSWIANFDNPDEDESPTLLTSYPTVALVADVFVRGPARVAADVWLYRHPDNEG